MDIFVIGGTGFIGRHVTRQLVERMHSVTVFHRGKTDPGLPSEVTTMHGTRDDRDDVRRAIDAARPDVVLDVIPYTETHAADLVEATSNVADRIVVLSSGDVYRQYDGLRGVSDHAPDPIPLTEEAPLRASRYPYRGSGADFEYTADYDKILVEEQVRSGSVPETILRLPKVYGPGDAENHLGRALDELLDADGVLSLTAARARWRWSRGYVENVAAAIVATVTNDRATGRTYNVGEPEALPEGTWLQRIARAADPDTTVRVGSADGSAEEPPFDWRYSMAMDTRRLRTELGFAEPTSHSDALERTIAALDD